MKPHRFYVPDVELAHDIWLHDEKLLHQWRNVLQFQPGRQVVLFDGEKHERLYKINELDKREAHLLLVTDFERKLPKRNVYLLWVLLNKNKNEWILQKGTETGVSHFLPLIAGQSEKTGFNLERAEKIVLEAAEQCGRSDVPTVREPMHVSTAIEQLRDKVELYICEQDGGEDYADAKTENVGVLIGPEGGWSDADKELFKKKGIKRLNLHDSTVLAETAVVAIVQKFLK